MPIISPPEHVGCYATIHPETDSEALLDISAEQILSTYKLHGAILFRGFDADIDTFGKFAAKFCANPVRNESGGRKTVDSDANIQTVNLGNDDFPLHPEISREPWKPDTCFFKCQVPPTRGGETILCDGIEIVERLPESLVERLCGQRLLYMVPATESELHYWLDTPTPSDEQLANPPANCPFSFHKQQSKVIRAFTAPFLHKTMFQSKRAFGNFLLFAWYYQKQRFYPMLDSGEPVDEITMNSIKKVSDELRVAVEWRQSDIVMIDNTRFMHGRNASMADDPRTIYSYFGYLDSAELTEEHYPNAPWRTSTGDAFINRVLK